MEQALSTEPGKLSTNEIQKLQREIQLLTHENKQLQVRAQGLQALGKVLEQSQEENLHLRHEIDDMREILRESSINPDVLQSRSDSRYSYSYGSRYPDSRSTLSGSYHLSVNPETGNLSDVSPAPSSIFNGDLHVKDVLTKLEKLKKEYEDLATQAQQLKDSTNIQSENPGEVQKKLQNLCLHLERNRKEARTRETLARALVVEEEEMKQKLQAMEAEQTSYEAAATQLEKDKAEGQAELENLMRKMDSYKKALAKQSDASGGSTTTQSSDSPGSSINSGRPTDEAMVVKSSATPLAPGECSQCGLLKRQNSELQRQLEGLRNERDEAVRQKEEILDVNHAWDAQYRKLQAETQKEINDLRQQIDILKDSEHGRHFDKVWSATKSKIDTERKTMEQEKKGLAERVQALEEERTTLLARAEHGQNQIKTLQQRLHLMSVSKGQRQETLGSSGKLNVLPPPPPVPPNTGTTSPTSVSAGMAFGRELPSPEIIDQIEALKQQLRVYADDFQSERSDRERMQSEKDRLKDQLEAVQQQVTVLEQQVRIYEDDFRREKREKEELESQLARAGMGPLGIEYPPHVQGVSRKAQSVAEQQAKVNAIREVHEREQRRLRREQQELMQQQYAKEQMGRYPSNFVPPYMPAGRYPYIPQESQSSYLHPRGPVDEMFRGGEVFPDRGVEVEDKKREKPDSKQDKDSAGPQKKECPRCLRQFSEDEAILKHIEKCLP